MIHLSDAEIADLCAPLSQPAAQVRYLRTLGLTVSLKPNGRPVVVRGQAEAVLAGRLVPSGASKANTMPEGGSLRRPSPAALVNLLRRGQTHGTAKNTQPAESAPTRLR
jgi:Domain of unknown function (DUF4224)